MAQEHTDTQLASIQSLTESCWNSCNESNDLPSPLHHGKSDLFEVEDVGIFLLTSRHVWSVWAPT